MKQAIIEARMYFGTFFVGPRIAKNVVARMMTSFDAAF
jgi:hypothetical protein